MNHADNAAHLRVRNGPDNNKGWDLDPRQVYFIGRSRACNIRLNDPTSSGSHCRISCEEDVWRLTDLGSTHGTHVNKDRVLDVRPLFDRDRIKVGGTLIEFREFETLPPDVLAEMDKALVEE